MRYLTTIIVFAASIAGPASAQSDGLPKLDLPPMIKPSESEAGRVLCAPERMTRMVTRNVSPGLAAAAPAAQPRTLYRQGSLMLRTEESPDPARGQMVVVVSEPDIWMFNTATNMGQHQVDPGPEFFVHAPILPISAELPPPLRTLEFGCELDFLKRHGADAPAQTIPWGGGKATVHQVRAGEHVVSMLLSQGRRAPLLVAYANAGKPVLMVRYDEYRNDLPDRPDLFSRPSLVEFAPAQPAPRPPAAPPATQQPTGQTPAAQQPTNL